MQTYRKLRTKKLRIYAKNSLITNTTVHIFACMFLLMPICFALMAINAPPDPMISQTEATVVSIFFHTLVFYPIVAIICLALAWGFYWSREFKASMASGLLPYINLVICGILILIML